MTLFMLFSLWLAILSAEGRPLLALNSTAALPPDELVREYWKLAQENNDLLSALERSARGSVPSPAVGVEARQYHLGCDVTVVNGNATIVIIRLSWMGALCRIRVLHAEERNHSYTHMSGGFLRSVMVKCHCQSAKGIG